jgi:hypothetical protein
MIHIENLTGSAQYAGAQAGWYSAHWELVPNGSAGGRQRAESGAESHESMDKDAFDVYPNPSATGRFTIALPALTKNESALVKMHDVNGKVLFEKKMTRTEEVEHQLKPGMYLLRAQLPAGVYVKKVIIN